jgi:hypothetical protein
VTKRYFAIFGAVFVLCLAGVPFLGLPRQTSGPAPSTWFPPSTRTPAVQAAWSRHAAAAAAAEKTAYWAKDWHPSGKSGEARWIDGACYWRPVNQVEQISLIAERRCISSGAKATPLGIADAR